MEKKRIFAGKSMRNFFAIVLTMTLFCAVSAQEFRCSVQVNYQKLLTTTQSYSSDGDKKVFDNMKQAIEDFVNGRRWTGLDFEQVEQIDCSISLVLNTRTSATDFTGQLQIQMRRPVYNSTYTTGLFNYMENGNFSFNYNENQPLDFDISNFYGILQSTLGYYCYIMLGIYFDSYSMNGGEPFFNMAQQVAQAVDASSYSGWDTKNSRGRYWFAENHLNSAYAQLHEAYYNYPRMGLDYMTKDQTQARQNILAALHSIQQVNKRRSGLLSVQQFMDVKIQELVSIFGPAPEEEQKEVYAIVKEVSPLNAAKLTGFATK